MLNLARMKKQDLVYLATHRCEHRHLFLEHPDCYTVTPPRVGFFDIETTAFDAGFGILLSWTFAVGTWMVFKFLTAGALSWLDPAARQLWLGLTVYTLAGWAVGGVAAIGVGWRRSAARRTA